MKRDATFQSVNGRIVLGACETGWIEVIGVDLGVAGKCQRIAADAATAIGNPRAAVIALGRMGSDAFP